GVKMDQHLHIITLGVRDFEASKKFYAETLGWKNSRPQEGIAFFQAGGVVLAIYPREKVAEDALVSLETEGTGFSGITLAYNAHSESEVDEIIRDLQSKGVKIVKEPQKAFWGGYSSYFADPDDYRWEVAYNPFFPFDENGNLKLD
ncbi:MAG TPA: VOC family protein, partial [Anaerolineales bacterium]|nr:VOC family protein [Anaerolineales bacterium]